MKKSAMGQWIVVIETDFFFLICFLVLMAKVNNWDKW